MSKETLLHGSYADYIKEYSARSGRSGGGSGQATGHPPTPVDHTPPSLPMYNMYHGGHLLEYKNIGRTVYSGEKSCFVNPNAQMCFHFVGIVAGTSNHILVYIHVYTCSRRGTGFIPRSNVCMYQVWE